MSGAKRRVSELQVGLLTILAIVVLIVGMMWLKDMDLSRGSAVYLVNFPEVEGMQPGDRVQVRGIRMGEVGALTMLADAVQAQLVLDASVKLREDAIVTLGEKGIVGEIVVEIEPGTKGKIVAPGYLFKGRTAGTIAAMTDAAGEALGELRVLTFKITELVDEVKTQGKVVETLAQTHDTLAKVDAMLQNNQNDVKVILDNMVNASQDLKDLLASGAIDSTLNRTSAAMVSADSLLVTLGESATHLKGILARLDSGDGTVGGLLKDDALYARTDSTLTAFQRLLDEMRRNPKKYFKVNLIDF